MQIRRFEPSDAEAVAQLIITTMKVSNSGDYSPKVIAALVDRHTPDYIVERAGWTHFYVAVEDDRIIGCGAIGPYWGKEDESSLFSIFVLPECQGRGVGREIIGALEADEYALRAKRIEIPSSITAVNFYRGLGYSYKNGITEPDEERLYRLEKLR